MKSSALFRPFVMTALLAVGTIQAADAAPAKAATAPAGAVPALRFPLPATDDGLPGAGPLRRAEWFQKMWNDRRTSFANRVRQDQGAIVFLGDSITQGWADQGSYFPGLKIANRGISGDTTRGVLLRLQEDVLVLNPRGVVLLIGTNDLEEQAPPETIAGNLKLILAALKQHNAAMPVVLCNVFPSSTTKKRPAEAIRRINQLFFAALRDEPQVTVLDTFALFANTQGEAKPEEFPDLLHPGPLGYAKWERALRLAFEASGLAAAWPDDFTPEAGFTSLFNGRDLTGWSYPDGANFDGKTVTDDSRFAAQNGRLVVTVSHLERAYKRILTAQRFPRDFVLKLEFRASPNADSGIFIRDVQLQCRDYHIAGPYFTQKGYRPLEWNEVVITVRGGLAHSTCNGEVIVDAMPVPGTGPIGFESDRGQVEYRRIRVMELK